MEVEEPEDYIHFHQEEGDDDASHGGYYDDDYHDEEYHDGRYDGEEDVVDVRRPEQDHAMEMERNSTVERGEIELE